MEHQATGSSNIADGWRKRRYSIITFLDVTLFDVKTTPNTTVFLYVCG